MNTQEVFSVEDGSGLTERQSEVANLMIRGLTDNEICEALGLSFSTIRTHASHIYSKLNLSGRYQLVASYLPDENCLDGLDFSQIIRAEHTVLGFMGDGMDNEQIATSMRRTQSTVRTHQANAANELGVRRGGLIGIAYLLRRKNLDIVQEFQPEVVATLSKIEQDHLQKKVNLDQPGAVRKLRKSPRLMQKLLELGYVTEGMVDFEVVGLHGWVAVHLMKNSQIGKLVIQPNVQYDIKEVINGETEFFLRQRAKQAA